MSIAYRLSLFAIAALASSALSSPALRAQPVSLDNLAEGSRIAGFRATALYLNDADRPMGARFVHERTGFTFDLLQIQSVPQAFIWVNTFPTSDMGEPHTQEHLLLGKGSRGRFLGSLETMTLSESNAFTQQWRTCYNFNTSGGPEAYYKVLRGHLDALLHPDYTDEEIRREVRNFGAAEAPDGKLRLEEKGTVYNEMVSTFERPWARMSVGLDHAVYGDAHPLAYVSGGLPAAIRKMGPDDIRKFHREHYHLGNMGMVGAFPKEMEIGEILRRTGAIFDELQPGEGGPKVMTSADLPAPRPAAAGTITIAEYPDRNTEQPGTILFAWPADRALDLNERVAMETFIDNIVGDAGTNLYNRFVDGRTRSGDVAAQSVFGWVSGDQGSPVYIGLGGVPPSSLTEERIAAARRAVADELAAIAAMKDGSPELAAFNARMLSRVTSSRRAMSKFVNSPPGFGFRNTGSDWMDNLYRLEGVQGFRKSVTLKPQLDFVRDLASQKKNVWRDRLAAWKLIDEVPYAGAARPSPALIEREAREREERIAAELGRLKAEYHLADDQATLQTFRSAYDSVSAELETIARNSPTPPFIASPPLTLDGQLDYTATKLHSGVPLVASTFDNMTSATAGIAFSLDYVRDDDFTYLSLFPALLSQVGVIDRGKPLSYEATQERQRQEILGLNSYFSSDFRSGRCELVVRGSGNDRAEAERAVEWMKLLLTSPNWSVENLPRIRDVVNQSLNALRGRMQGSEESWVNDPADAYLKQGNPLFLATGSFLSQEHNAFRLRWLLKDTIGMKGAEPLDDFLIRLADSPIGAPRPSMEGLLRAIQGDSASRAALHSGLRPLLAMFDALPADARSTALEAVKDLSLEIASVPDDIAFPNDWRTLCLEMRHGLIVPAREVLADLARLRERIAGRDNARTFVVGSGANGKALATKLDALITSLPDKPNPPRVPDDEPGFITARIRNRNDGATPIYVGLVNPNTTSGVFINSAPGITYADTSREALLRHLSTMLYGGHGAHGIFMKTWGAGLAYSNGLGASPRSGRMRYYAERCPSLPQTLGFVIDVLRSVPRDSGLVDYALAQAFGESRAASTYEARGEAMAADLADGITPEVVSRFRRAILALRGTPNLAGQLYDRMAPTIGRVLPGYGPSTSKVEGGIYFVIGPEQQLQRYEEYLKSIEGPSARLYPIYPRDYWMVRDITSAAGN
jgi:Zn-dependent M16 (insulinase) family peptidase